VCFGSRSFVCVARFAQHLFIAEMKRDSKAEEAEGVKNKRNKGDVKATKILFVGNSFTTRNNVPEMISEMCKQRNICVQTKVVAKGGASLKQHWNANALGGDEWDFVVLQVRLNNERKAKRKIFSFFKKYFC
jgi:hypothetical protein